MGRKNRRESPLGIKLLALYAVLIGLGGLLLAMDGQLFMVVFTLVALVTAHGLWTLEEWGLLGIVLLAVGSIVMSVIEILDGNLASAVTVVLSVLALGYVYSKRRFFHIDLLEPITSALPGEW